MALTQITTDGIKDGTITGTDLTTNIDLVDNQKLRLGTGNDLQIFHDGSNSYIKEDGTGSLLLWSTGTEIKLLGGSGAETLADFNVDGAAELYYDNVKKFETTSTGGKLTSSATTNGSIVFDVLSGIRGYLYADNANNIGFLDSDADWLVKGTKDAGVELHFNGSKKFETTNTGVTVTGRLEATSGIRGNDNVLLQLGTANDLVLYHDGSNSFVSDQGTGSLQLNSNGTGIELKTDATETMAKFLNNGAVELYYDNSKKFETYTYGVNISGTAKIESGGNFHAHDNVKFIAGTGEDLQIYHDGSNSYLDNATGNFEIRSNEFRVKSLTSTEPMIHATKDAEVRLYYDNGIRLQTEAWGTRIMTTGQDAILSIQAEDNRSAEMRLLADNGDDNADYTKFRKDKDTAKFHIQNLGSGSWEDNIVCINQGAVELYYDNSKKLETTSAGIDVTGRVTTDELSVVKPSGNLSANFEAQSGLGTLEIGGSTGAFIDLKTPFTDDFDLRINSDGVLTSGGNIQLNVNGGENGVRILQNDSVELYYNNSKKFETTSGGVDVIGALTVNGSAFAGGKVLQQVSATKLTTASNNVGSQNTWEYNDSSLMVTITGASTNNKFLFLGQLTICGEVACHIGLRHNQNSSNVTGMMATGTSNRRASTSGNSAAATDDHSAMTVPIIGLISVPDTNAHSYYYQISHTSGSTREIVINGARNSGDNAERGRYISSLTVMEISG